MIYVLTYKDSHHFNQLKHDHHRLRQREFVDRQGYAVKSIDDLEFDEYDNLAAVYLIYSEDGRTALGASRLLPVTYGCMIKDHFPHLVDDPRVFHAPKIWEATRLCVDSRLPPPRRRVIAQALACAYLEFGLTHEVAAFIGVMPTLLLRSVFERNGVSLSRLGAPHPIGDQQHVQAAAIVVSEAQLRCLSAATGLSHVLETQASDRGERHAA